MRLRYVFSGKRDHLYPQLLCDVCGEPITLEQQLHQRFANKRVRGEWFALNTDDVDYIKGL